MDAVYPASASALSRGRRVRRAEPRARRRTTPVTFAEIKEVDEEKAESCGDGPEWPSEERRRRPDVLEERLGLQLAESRRRRRPRGALRELSPPPAPVARAGSEPAALHRDPGATHVTADTDPAACFHTSSPREG